MMLYRLHTAVDGQVWFGTDNQPAVNSHNNVSGFMRKEALNIQDSEVRVLGTEDNAKLISNCWDAKTQVNNGFNGGIFLGSPNLCSLQERVADPPHVLRRMWQLSTADRMPGCWHRMHAWDALTYNYLAGQPGDSRLRAHPGWPVISFLPGLKISSAERLLRDIVDPRWYQHPEHPGRLSRLYRHLGLVPAVVRRFVHHEKPLRVEEQRAYNAISCWYPQTLIVSIHDPTAILTRCYWNYPKQPNGDVTKVILATTKKLVQFLVLVWLGDLNLDKHREIGFDSRLFFHHLSERSAFIEHINSATRV